MLLPLAQVNPNLPLTVMGAKAAGQKSYELSQQGVGASEALTRGIAAGGIEILTEKLLEIKLIVNCWESKKLTK